MFKIIRFAICCMAVLAQTLGAQGWLGKDLSNINVKELTSAQREEVLRNAKRQGFNEADLEAMARARGLNVDEFKRRDRKSVV